ncbi:MAG: terminase small subunit [Desulfovibrionaceae bacterium]
MAGKLTPKQAAFVAEYLIDLNATQAAIRAGYSARTAGSQGERLLKKVEIQIALAEAQQKRAERTEISQDRVLLEYSKLAFHNPQDFYDDKGNLIEVHKLPRDVAAAITSMEVSVDAEGKSKLQKIKLADKKGALDSVARHLGMFNDSLNLNGDIHVLNVHRRAKKSLAAEEGES